MRLSNKFLAAVLVVVGIGLYLPSFGNGMFWDDDDFILNNVYIKDWQYLPKLFSEDIIAGSGLVSNYWRPMLLVIFSIEWHMWGSWVPGWHMVNTLFHVVNGVLLFWVLNKTYRTDRTYIPFFVSLLFLVHPVQVEAVAYVNSLGDSLSVFFMFVGVLCFQRFMQLVSCRVTIRYPELRNLDSSFRAGTTTTGDGRHKSSRIYFWLALSVFSYPLALMSKETAIVMPGLLALVVAWYWRLNKKDGLDRTNGANKRANRTYMTYRAYILSLFSFAIIAITYLVLRATTLNFKNSFNLYDQQNVFTDSLWVRLLTFCKIVVEYIKLIFWPAHLHMERTLEFAASLFEWQVILGGLMIIGLLVVAWKAWRKNPLISFGILWFFIALAPTSNILVPINGLLYEHWLYVPIVGAGIALAATLANTRSVRAMTRDIEVDRPGFRLRGRDDNGAYLIVVIAIVIVSLSTRSIIRIRDWRDPVAFYKQTLQHAPDSYRINNNLAMELANKGSLREAISYYERAISLDPKNVVAYHNLGNTYVSLGDSTRGISNYKKALAADPHFLFSYGKLINAYASLGRYAEAAQTVVEYEQQVGKTAELEAVRAALEARVKR